MPKWEYSILDLSDLPPKADMLSELNDAGLRGWELIAITFPNRAILKRALAEKPPRAPASSAQGAPGQRR